jgi:serine/threonine protein kinase/formylglycine-generating enzyme required for sulfatase activity
LSDEIDDQSLWQIVNEFVERKHRGELPTIDEYCDSHPQLAAQIRDLFPTLELVENVQPTKPTCSARILNQLSQIESFGDYLVIREIGCGGMGIVYEAKQKSLGRRVALKVLPRSSRDSEVVEARFLREARAAAQMHHTNIVPVFEVSKAEDCFFYAMQLIDGKSLDLILEELGHNHQHDRAGELSLSILRSPERRSCQEGQEPSSTNKFGHLSASIALQVAEALAYAHSRGIIHRDIKPSNLLLDGQGVVWVTDFGLAKIEEEELTRSGDFLGTLRYMAPERFRGHCDGRADVYALGLTLYELLVQRPAFASPDRLQLIDQINSTDPTPLSLLDQRISRDLETIVLKSIDKDPNGRYQSAQDLADDLRRYLDDEPIHARRHSLPELLHRWARRNKGLAAALSAIVLLVTAVAIGSSLAAAKFHSQNEVIRRNADLAATRLEEISRLSDSQRLEDLINEAEQLWPASPGKIGAFEEWVENAKGLVSRLPRHERDLAALRERASSEASANDEGEIDQWRIDDAALHWQHRTLTRLVSGVKTLKSDDPTISVLASVKKRLQFAQSVRQRTIEDYRLEWERACKSIANPHECPQYAGLVIKPQLGLVPLGRDPDSGLWEFAHLETGAIPVRQDGKLMIDGNTGLVFVLLPGGTFTMGAEPLDLGVLLSANQITAGEDYPSIEEVTPRSFATELKLQPGDRLVAINGRRVSSQEEMKAAVNDFGSGDTLRFEILRNGVAQELVAEIPANVDSLATPAESPLHELTLAPFFISKFEMTQGQWARFTGNNPSSIQALWLFKNDLEFDEANQASADPQLDPDQHPIESISWQDAMEVLEHRLDIRLPTEAQWEYAARAGTTTVVWFGNRVDDFDNAGNVSDRFAFEHVTLPIDFYDMQINDGFVTHAPVGIYRANAFGIHDTVGNVAELCRDGYQEFSTSMLPGTGERPMNDHLLVVVRGSSFRYTAMSNRSAGRIGTFPHKAEPTVGVRPAREVNE